jgi:DtxR family Mn-dependent transcriptional regulator
MNDTKVKTQSSPGSAPKSHISGTVENYLSSLYKLAEWGVTPTAVRLADYLRHLPATERLGSSLPSVLGMLRRMSREGLIKVSREKQVFLTAIGYELAEVTVRRHRLAECLVVNIIGMDLHLACVEGHSLEHAISLEMEVHLQRLLGKPTTSPFGAPIPGNGYVAPRGGIITLEEAVPGTVYHVDRVDEEDPILLRYLVEHGVLPNARFTVIEAGKYRGVLIFRTDEAEGSLGYGAVQRVRLKRSTE